MYWESPSSSDSTPSSFSAEPKKQGNTSRRAMRLAVSAWVTSPPSRYWSINPSSREARSS